MYPPVIGTGVRSTETGTNSAAGQQQRSTEKVTVRLRRRDALVVIGANKGLAFEGTKAEATQWVVNSTS